MNIGERIKAARSLAGLSQRGLAEAAEISAMAISKYERNLDMPGSAVMIRLARALGVKVEYFFRPIEARLSMPVFRYGHMLSEAQRELVVARVQEWVERYVQIEQLLDLTDAVVLPGPYRVATPDEAEIAAQRLRIDWNIGIDPIDGLLSLCEDRGIKIGLADGPDAFIALTLLVNEKDPVIALKREMPGDRQRFSLAHELGHLVLEFDSTMNQHMIEELINRFAGAFLAPADNVRNELGPRRSMLSIYELHLLKHKYGLSMQGWIHRAGDLGILSDTTVRELRQQFDSQNWREREPGDQLQSEVPQRFERLIMRALTEDCISPGRAAELLGKPLEQFIAEEERQHTRITFVLPR